jgi:hypothetical protein
MPKFPRIGAVKIIGAPAGNRANNSKKGDE